jgi:hypothetical protein
MGPGRELPALASSPRLQHPFSVTKHERNESIKDARTSSSIRRDHCGGVRFPPTESHRCVSARTGFRGTLP